MMTFMDETLEQFEAHFVGETDEEIEAEVRFGLPPELQHTYHPSHAGDGEPLGRRRTFIVRDDVCVEVTVISSDFETHTDLVSDGEHEFIVSVGDVVPGTL